MHPSRPAALVKVRVPDRICNDSKASMCYWKLAKSLHMLCRC
jgi:hypothetical protein